MSYATTYCIRTSLYAKGDTCDVDYWPDGEGQEWPGYATSLSQLSASLHKNLSPSSSSSSFKLSFHATMSDGTTKHITDDEDLISAVGPLPDRGVLFVTAFEHEKSKGKRKGKAKKKRNEYEHEDAWYATESEYSQSDDSSEDDNDDNDDNDSVDDDFEYAYAVETKEAKVQSILERFNAIIGITCYHCDTTDFKGERYCYEWDAEYSLCAKCHKKLPKVQKSDWKKTGIYRESDVPSYPLYREDELPVRDEVGHLQFLLTLLGFMPLSATKQLVGSYQSNTEKAVRKFREKHGIKGSDMTVYDAKTAKKLSQVVKKAREDGHKYI